MTEREKKQSIGLLGQRGVLFSRRNTSAIELEVDVALANAPISLVQTVPEGGHGTSNPGAAKRECQRLPPT